MPSQQTNAQAQWGQWFRVPGLTTQEKSVPDNRNKNLSVTLNQGSSQALPTTTLDQQDIITGLIARIAITETYTPGSGKTITQSTLFPWNYVQMASVNLESSYNAFQMPGILAFVMQSYRPLLAGGAGGVGSLAGSGVNTQQGETVTSALTPSPTAAGLTGTTVSTSTSPLYLNLEIPLAATFDVYYEFDAGGNILWKDERRIVSPQYMAATERSVTPNITFAAGMLAQTGGSALLSPATIAANDSTSTYAGSATTTIIRKGYFSPNDPRTVPPVSNSQYARGYFTVPTNGQLSFPIPLASDPVGQGQLLSFIFFIWDPTLNSGIGGVVPYSQVAHIELQTSSSVINYYDTVTENQNRWLEQHGVMLPPGFWGFDRALTDDRKFTNENAINTITVTGVQVVVYFNAGQAASSTSTCYVGMELLKFVPIQG